MVEIGHKNPQPIQVLNGR